MGFNLFVAFWLIIDPKDELIRIFLRHRDLLQFCGLEGSIEVVIIDDEVGERQNENLFLIGVLGELFNFKPFIDDDFKEATSFHIFGEKMTSHLFLL
jgi:hypothetical protein